MIDWKRRGLDLAVVVNRYEKDRLIPDRKLIFKMAAEMLRLAEIEKNSKKKFLEWNRCDDPSRAQILYQEYLEIVRSVRNEQEDSD